MEKSILRLFLLVDTKQWAIDKSGAGSGLNRLLYQTRSFTTSKNKKTQQFRGNKHARTSGASFLLLLTWCQHHGQLLAAVRVAAVVACVKRAAGH